MFVSFPAIVTTCLSPFYLFPATTNYDWEGGDNPIPTYSTFFGLRVYKRTPSSSVAHLDNHPWLLNTQTPTSLPQKRVKTRRVFLATRCLTAGCTQRQKATCLDLLKVCFWYFLPSILLMEEILHQLVGSLSYDLVGLILPRWCRISSINSTNSSTICGNISALFFSSIEPSNLNYDIVVLSQWYVWIRW